MSAATEQLAEMAQELQQMTGQFRIRAADARAVPAEHHAELPLSLPVSGGLDVEHIDMAIGAHGTWKVRIREAIHGGRAIVKPETVRRDDQCDFGKWLLSLAPEDLATELGSAVRGLHTRFHQEVARILALALEGKGKEAEQALGRTGSFASLSSDLTQAMLNWKQALLSAARGSGAVA